MRKAKRIKTNTTSSTIREKLQSLSEDDLRVSIIIPLLYALGCTEVRDNCGPDEKGKDIIYSTPHLLGANIYGAVILKNDRNLGLGKMDNLRSQALRALNAFGNPRDPRIETKVHELIFVTSFDITSDVRDFLVKNCGSNFPNMHFVDGVRLELLIRKIIDLFKKLTGRTYVFDITSFAGMCDKVRECNSE